MNDENDFLQTILANPNDPAPRLVYADWLEERGNADSRHRAEYLRVEFRLDGLPKSDRQRRKLQERLSELRKLVGNDWWRQLDYAKVDNCVEFAYRCPQRWDTLQPTANDAVRHCSVCKRDVHYCRSTSEAHRLADKGECVAIDSRLLKINFGLLRTGRESGRLLGKVAPSVPARVPLNKRGEASQRRVREE